MGFLDFEDENNKPHFRKIKRVLRRRGLAYEPDVDDWKIHGPHPGMNYQTYNGLAFVPGDSNAECTCDDASLNYACKRHPEGSFEVNILPKGVFNCEDGERIPCLDTVEIKECFKQWKPRREKKGEGIENEEDRTSKNPQG